MHPAMIQAALKMQGFTQRRVASDCGGISAVAVNHVINGASRSANVEKRIAAITGLSLAVLWPQWHGPNAKRRRARMSTADMAQQMRALAG